MAVLRGINTNPGAEPEDMPSLRLWACASRVLTLRGRPMQTPRAILTELERSTGPCTTGDLVVELTEQPIARMGASIADINDRIDRMESDGEDGLLDAIAAIRRNVLGLKRHMSPQHEALEQIGRDPPAWLSEANRRDVRETQSPSPAAIWRISTSPRKARWCCRTS